MITEAEVGDKPLTNDECDELERQAKFGTPDPILVLRLVSNGSEMQNKDAYEEGYDEGHDVGYEEGYADGHDAGYDEGEEEAA